MANTHALPDTFAELAAWGGDLWAAFCISTTITTPGSGLVLPAFATRGYVRAGNGAQLFYVNQPAVTVTLAGGNGTYYLLLQKDLTTPVSGWTRRGGSHYMWQLTGTFPGHPDGGLVFASATVSGGNITAVTPLVGVQGPPLSHQTASNVVITGGSLSGLTTVNIANNYAFLDQTGFHVLDHTGNDIAGLRATVSASGGTNRWGINCDGTAPSYLGGTLQTVGTVGINVAPTTSRAMNINWIRANGDGIAINRADNDNAGFALLFNNFAGSIVGTITTTATATAYNTSSDARLKHAIEPLTDALTTLAALRPVRFRWNADDSEGSGFLAHEVQQVVPDAVTGDPDAVTDDGQVQPQGMDMSKLVPYLSAACKELLAQVEALTARVATLEAAL